MSGLKRKGSFGDIPVMSGKKSKTPRLAGKQSHQYIGDVKILPRLKKVIIYYASTCIYNINIAMYTINYKINI